MPCGVCRCERQANVDKLAVTGFLLGRPHYLALRRAHNQNEGRRCVVQAAGRGDNAMTPANPIDLVDKINAPVLGLYGDADGGIPNDTVGENGRCAESQRQRARSSSTWTHRTRSTPTIARVIARRQPRRRGRSCWRGSKANGVLA